MIDSEGIDMKEYKVHLDEVTAFLIEEFARKSNIQVEEAIKRCIRYVVRELSPQPIKLKNRNHQKKDRNHNRDRHRDPIW